MMSIDRNGEGAYKAPRRFSFGQIAKITGRSRRNVGTGLQSSLGRFLGIDTGNFFYALMLISNCATKDNLSKY